MPPKTNKSHEEWERLKRLEHLGKIRLGSGRLPKDFWKLPRPEDPEGLVRRTLVEDRR